jgi:hypothetical protein
MRTVASVPARFALLPDRARRSNRANRPNGLNVALLDLECFDAVADAFEHRAERHD